jgi:hypothetical protein
VYPSELPTRKKLLPRPCPQCGGEYGGVQIVLINPRYYWHRTGYRLRTRLYEEGIRIRFVYPPYVIVRISHSYSKTELTKNKTRKKIVHSFSSFGDWNLPINPYDNNSRTVKARQVFTSNMRYKQCRTFPLSPLIFEDVKFNGWNIFDNTSAHWTRRANMKFCQMCKRATKQLREYETPMWNKFQLCEKCISYYENFRSTRKPSEKTPSILEQTQNL